jgi:ribosomal protein L7/L12
MELSPEQLQSVRDLVTQDRKIEAIKRYRELTGTRLEAAKAAVEAMAQGEAAPPGALDDARLAPLVEDLYAGRKIAAVKRYRELLGTGLKEAKDAVDQLEVRLRQEHPERFTQPAGKGCARTAAMLVLAVAALAWGLLRYC